MKVVNTETRRLNTSGIAVLTYVLLTGSYTV